MMSGQTTTRPNLVGATYNQQQFFTELYAATQGGDH